MFAAYFNVYSRRKTRVWIYITGSANRMHDQEARKDDKPLILPIEVWCLDWTRSFPYPFHIITAGTETIFPPTGNCDSLSAKGWQGGMTGEKIGGWISTSLRSDQSDLFLLYLLSTSRSPSLPPKTDTVAHVLLHRFSNNTVARC